MKHAQLAFLATERDEFVEPEEDGRSGEVVREVGVLDEADGAVQQDEHVEHVEQLVGGPERGEDVRAGGRRREDVHDADDDHQQHARETCVEVPATRGATCGTACRSTCGRSAFTLAPTLCARSESFMFVAEFSYQIGLTQMRRSVAPPHVSNVNHGRIYSKRGHCSQKMWGP